MKGSTKSCPPKKGGKMPGGKMPPMPKKSGGYK